MRLDFDDRNDRDLGAVEHHADWVSAHKGLRVYHTAIVIQIVLVVLSVLLGLALAGSRSRSFAEIYVVLTSVMSLAVGVVALVGLARYVRVPSISGGRGLAIAALSLSSVNLLISLVQNIGILSNVRRALRHGGRGEGALTILALLAGLAMLITFILSMSRVAAFIGRPEIEASARNVLALLVALIVGGVLMVAIAVGARGAGDGIALVLSFIVLGLAIWMLVAYLGAINALSNAIRDDVGIERVFD